MKIRVSVLRKLIREAVLQEAQMQDPLAVAVGTALVNHINSDAFVKAVQQNLGGKKGDPERAGEELIVTFPQSQMYRDPIETLLQKVGGGEPAQQQFARQKPSQDGAAPEERKTIAPPRM